MFLALKLRSVEWHVSSIWIEAFILKSITSGSNFLQVSWYLNNSAKRWLNVLLFYSLWHYTILHTWQSIIEPNWTLTLKYLKASLGWKCAPDNERNQGFWKFKLLKVWFSGDLSDFNFNRDSTRKQVVSMIQKKQIVFFCKTILY